MSHLDDLRADYDEHGFGARLGAGEKVAVLVVDVLKAYLEPGSPLYAGAEDAVRAAGHLVDAARAAGTPVVFTCVRYARGLVDGGLWVRKVPALRVLEVGSPLEGFGAEVAPREGETVVVKQVASAFLGTELEGTLRTAGIDTVLVVGLSTSGCVRATVVDAVSLGFRPLVVREAVGDRDPAPHEAALFDIDAKYGDVIGLAEAVGIVGR